MDSKIDRYRENHANGFIVQKCWFVNPLACGFHSGLNEHGVAANESYAGDSAFLREDGIQDDGPFDSRLFGKARINRFNPGDDTRLPNHSPHTKRSFDRGGPPL